MNRLLKNSVIFLLAISLFSCKSSDILTGGNVSNISDAKLRNSLIDNELDYNKLYSKKLSISFDDGNKSKSFKGSYVIQKDSVIMLSIMAVMGIEVVRAQFRPDSIIIIDKHNKKVLKSDYSYLFEKYGVDLNYQILQSLLSNSAFIYPSTDDIYDGLRKYKHGISNNTYTFSTIKSKRLNRLNKREANNKILHEMSIYPDLFRINRQYIKDYSSNQTLDIVYDNFTQYSNMLFPKNIDITANKGTSVFNLSLITNQLDINKGGSLHFKIPSSYEIINL